MRNWKTILFVIAALLAPAGALACSPAEPAVIEQTVEVTRIVEQTVPVTRERTQLVRVTRVVEQTVEVTRVVEQPVEVTRIVEKPVEVTREVPVTVAVVALPTPTSVAAPTPTSPPNHDWQYAETGPDPITDISRKHMVSLGRMTNADDAGATYNDPQLFLRCTGSEFEAFTDWGGRALSGDAVANILPGIVRVDGRQPRTRGMHGTPSDDERAAVFVNPRALVAELIGGQEAVIRVTNSDATTLTARFPIAGLHVQLYRLPCY